MVNEKKLVLFLQTEVTARSLRSKPKKIRKGKGKEVATPVEVAELMVEHQQKKLKYQTVRTYIIAVVNLFESQVSRGLNSVNNTPHGHALKALQDSLKQNETRQKREQYDNRAIGTIQDGYNAAEMVSIAKHLWSSDANTTKAEQQLRTLVDFLLGHYFISRDENRYMMQLADLFTLELDNEGPTACFPLIMIMNNGKCNQFSRIEYAAALRNKDILLCPIRAIASYFVYR